MFYEIGYHIPGDLYYRSNNFQYMSKAAAIRRAKWILKYTDADRVTVTKIDGRIYTEIFQAPKNDLFMEE